MPENSERTFLNEVLHLNNGRKYIGQVNKDKLPNGYGFLLDCQGTLFEYYWLNDAWKGEGRTMADEYYILDGKNSELFNMVQVWYHK